MSLFTASLNSGSNANCYYVGNQQEAVLIDAGLSCRETEKRMQQLQLPMERVKAIFVSHEHGDHISGVPGLSKKYQLPVYITPGTLQQGNIPLEPSLVHSFHHHKPVSIGDLQILPFRKSHDAADPHSFLVSAAGANIGIITDIGYPCRQVIHFFSQCHAAFLESNYCEEMLEKGNYPYPLKKRISGDEGHLSNKQALDLFLAHRSPDLQLLVLSHLSKNNNHPEIVERMFAPHAGKVKIVVASRYAVSELFEVRAGVPQWPVVGQGVVRRKRVKGGRDERQLSLF